MKYYIADVMDKRWNDVEFSFVGAFNGKTYVKTDENVSFAKEVKLPNELQQKQVNLTQLKEQFINAIDEVLNTEAKKRGYDDIKSARSYAGYDNPFRAESEAFGKWSAGVWQWGYALLERIKNGEVDINTLELSQVLKDMPKLEITNKE